jgi:hypothetical protein
MHHRPSVPFGSRICCVNGRDPALQFPSHLLQGKSMRAPKAQGCINTSVCTAAKKPLEYDWIQMPPNSFALGLPNNQQKLQLSLVKNHVLYN